MFDSLITDRTVYDFLHWKDLRDKGYANMTDAERQEWDSADMKGAYNASDVNRVGAVLNYLLDRYKTTGYLRGNEFVMRTDWTEAEMPTAADFTAYIKAIKTIHDAMAQKSTTPLVPRDTGSLDYQGANDIEQILLDIEDLINKMLKSRYYMGELFSGEI